MAEIKKDIFIVKNTNKLKTPKRSLRMGIILTLVAVVVFAVAAWFFLPIKHLLPYSNYAEEIAKPLETALVKAGAVKKCGTGDDGRGWDNKEPWYYAIYEVPGNRERATELVKSAAKEAGFSLTDGKLPLNPEDNKFYEDLTSKANSAGSQPGAIGLLVDIYGSRTFNGEGGRFCGVTKRDNAQADKTTVRFTINAPPSKN